MDYRIIETNNGILAAGNNEHGRRVELNLTGHETVHQIKILFDQAKTEIEKEKERIEKENKQLEDEKNKLSETNEKLAEENSTLKTLAEDLAAAYARNKESYPAYEIGKVYKFGDSFVFEDKIYMYIGASPQEARKEWKPSETPALYTLIGATDETTGLQELTPSSENTYNAGVIGTYQGRVFKSKFPNNGVLPIPDTGWWEDLGTIEEYLESKEG